MDISTERAPPSKKIVTIYKIFSEGKIYRTRKFQLVELTHTQTR